MKTNQSQTAPAEVRENIMGTMEINPLLLKLSIPMMISMLVQALYNVVDSVFVSHVSESPPPPPPYRWPFHCRTS